MSCRTSRWGNQLGNPEYSSAKCILYGFAKNQRDNTLEKVLKMQELIEVAYEET
jgi:hypothetical protein